VNWACRIILAIFIAAYLVALALLVIGTFGLFGSERDPLAGVFLAPLGLPWNRLLDGVSDTARPWLAAATPALNVLCLWLMCRTLSRFRSTP
jgi:hypothetical protein